MSKQSFTFLPKTFFQQTPVSPVSGTVLAPGELREIQNPNLGEHILMVDLGI